MVGTAALAGCVCSSLSGRNKCPHCQCILTGDSTYRPQCFPLPRGVVSYYRQGYPYGARKPGAFFSNRAPNEPMRMRMLLNFLENRGISQITTTQTRTSPADGSTGTTRPDYVGVGIGPAARLGFVQKIYKKTQFCAHGPYWTTPSRAGWDLTKPT